MACHGERVANLSGRAYWETGRALTLFDCTVAARGLAQRWLPGFAGGLTRLGGAAPPSREGLPGLNQLVPPLALAPPVGEAPEHIPGTNGCGEIRRSSC
jgi:hypothetical protein